MKCNKRLITGVVEIAIGLILVICGHAGIIDEYWSGMGTAFVFVGFVSLVRMHRYKTNMEYKEKFDVSVNDERNQYLRMKAWSWTGYLFVLLAAFGSIVFRLIGLDVYSLVAGFAVCLLMILYWISYWVLGRKS